MKTAIKVLSILGIAGAVLGIVCFILLGIGFYNGSIIETFGTITVNGETVTAEQLSDPEVAAALHMAGAMFWIMTVVYIPSIVLDSITLWKINTGYTKTFTIVLGIIQLVLGNTIVGILLLLLKTEDIN